MVCFHKIITCTIIGDGMIGKTCMAQAFTGNRFSNDYIATVAGSYTGSVSVYGDKYEVDVKDTNGQHEEDDARAQAVTDADVIIVCYSAVDRDSFENVKLFWMFEARSYNRKKPVILVATQSEIRDENNAHHVTDVEGQNMTRLINAEYYNKCSAAAKIGMKNVFESAVLASVKYKKKKANILKRVFGR